MFGLFKKDPIKKLEKEYKQLLVKARDVQRSGDIVAYSAVVAESEEVLRKIEGLRANKK
ncbi:MAG: Lacal_2735 family protein [Saprospiraceae bacterium]|nr:Lacal_2735 family protein [Saprospiraceae bacterium]